MDFFDRIGHVEIATADDGIVKSLRDVDFKFHVEKSVGGIKDSASVSVLGLNSDTIQFLSTFIDQSRANIMRRRARVYAGYADSGEHLIIDGDIVQATPTSPPDQWLNMTVICNAYRNREMISMALNGSKKWTKETGQIVSTYGIKLKSILDAFVKHGLGIKSWTVDPYISLEDKYRIDGFLETQLRCFDCTGTKDDIINEINLFGDWIVREEEGTLIISIMRPGPTESSSRTGYNTAIRVIDEEHGMVGIPQFKYPNCVITTRINPAIKIFDEIELRCKYNTSANGIYKIYNIIYDGQLRGQPWYARLNARNINAR